jgi:hypothetical protein
MQMASGYVVPDRFARQEDMFFVRYTAPGAYEVTLSRRTERVYPIKFTTAVEAWYADGALVADEPLLPVEWRVTTPDIDGKAYYKVPSEYIRFTWSGDECARALECEAIDESMLANAW